MALGCDDLVEMLRLMYTIRSVECRLRQLYEENRLRGLFLGALHSSEGQEATAVGALYGLRPDDYVISTHRGHGHLIARGGDPGRMVAELLGKEAGYSKGRGGSMHMFDVRNGFLGGNGIVGGGIPLALGPAFAAQYRGTDQVTVCFFGDGGACQGVFHESLNLASLWKLPVIYVCENNQYAVTTPVAQTIAGGSIAARAAAYGCPGVPVDGNDVLAVHQAASEAVGRARAGDGPTLLECSTYRHHAHCMVIADRRKPAEVAAWKDRDPLLRFEQRLLAEQVMTEAEQSDLRRRVQEAVEQAVAFAEASPYPDVKTALDYVWA
jgi:TPP-dependent pyruvate/acetoin dehydrogenase alpha subunit